MHRMATRYYSHGMYADSVLLLEFLLRHMPTNAELYYELGKGKHAQADHAAALAGYQRAVLLGLPDLEVYLYMGQCLIFLRKLPQAASALRNFIALANADEHYRSSPLLARGQHLLQDLVLPQIQVNLE